MYWIQFDDGRTDSLDECYCWQCTLDSLQANQEAATLSAASDCGSSESDDDDAEEEGTASDAPSVYEDSDASSDGEETETGEGDIHVFHNPPQPTTHQYRTQPTTTHNFSGIYL